MSHKRHAAMPNDMMLNVSTKIKMKYVQVACLWYTCSLPDQNLPFFDSTTETKSQGAFSALWSEPALAQQLPVLHLAVLWISGTTEAVNVFNSGTTEAQTTI